ncbi:Bug family tripartite tricarboxylate transporter substrate binding protein [Pelosinus baikalensis]|uniref:Tripartite tricarboxylate transporter substrate binding protein n=1 Tax=Pelosinus baikalensis TaxID=2892015 RepID=A0ABS8HZU0_9FIRM|nr:tripartite tricarboxylate transporter substrate binding protein [Pelosinus baikalensis]MCC5468694.1 tripartite tricarboxylate transporter substrate binding protein [Pelosinus baikalensis]
MGNKLINNEYPDKPIIVIVPNSAGGSMDTIGRMLQKMMIKDFDQSLVILNKTGGAGTKGWDFLAGCVPDGYTIGLTNSDITWQPLFGEKKYNYITALDPLAQVGATSMVLSVLSDQPWQNINDLVDDAKQHPEAIKYGHPGIGSARHILGEMFKKEAGINLDQVPFSNGESEALAAFLGGHVKVLISSPALVKQFVKEGRVRVLAVADETRLADPIFADVPTFKEQGLDVVLTSWEIVAAPKYLPEDVKAKLVKELKIVINDPDFIKDMEIIGLTVKYLGPEECQNKWINEHKRLEKIVKETGIVDVAASKN